MARLTRPIRFVGAGGIVLMLLACSSSNQTAPTTGIVSGTVTSSLGGPLSGVAVVVTPAGGAALPAVSTATNGTYSVSAVPSGSGSVAFSGVPVGCTPPTAVGYTGLAGNGTATANATVTCQIPAGLSLTVGQSATFTDSSHFTTGLALQPGSQYLVAVVNTDTGSTDLEDFTLVGSFNTVSGASVSPARALPIRGSGARVQRTAGTETPQSSAISPELARALRVAQKAARAHVARLEQTRALFQQYGNPSAALRAAAGARRRPTVSALSLVGTTVGAVNKIFFPSRGCDTTNFIFARTVYVGQHIQVLADTQAWSQRPDSSYYAAFGSEYDSLTYQHLLTYIGNPLLIDADLSNVGKVTFVFTPAMNTQTGDIAFVSGCDFFPKSEIPSSNVTEMVYGWMPDSVKGYALSLWGRNFRSTAAHESKHVVSFAQHIFDDAASFEQSWLEEALAQESSEIWARHFNQATWKSHAGFDATIGCEYEPSNPCYRSSNPLTLVIGHPSFLFQYLDSAGAPVDVEGLASTVEGKYGAGWSFARWATDLFGSTEPVFIKSLIDDPTNTGMSNVSAHSGQRVTQMLVYWSLATALDQSTLADSTTFLPLDARATVPGFDFRNIYSSGASTTAGHSFIYYSRSYPLRPRQVDQGTLNTTVNGIPGTGASYFLLTNAGSAGTQLLELRSGSGTAISPASGFRVGIIRVQ